MQLRAEKLKLPHSALRRQQKRRLQQSLRVGICWGLMMIGGVLGGGILVEKFFFHNKDYNLQNVEGHLDHLMTVPEALQVMGIHEGTNLFTISLSQAADALQHLPQVQSVRIERRWPNQLAITVHQRNWVAWLKSHSQPQSSLLVDDAGHAIPPYGTLTAQQLSALPVIYCSSLEAVEQDPLVHADLQAAVALLAEQRIQKKTLLNLQSIDISKGYLFEIQDVNGTKILFAPHHFAAQFTRLNPLLDWSKKNHRSFKVINLIPQKCTPVQYAQASQEHLECPESSEEPEKNAPMRVKK